LKVKALKVPWSGEWDLIDAESHPKDSGADKDEEKRHAIPIFVRPEFLGDLWLTAQKRFLCV
jgi:hypothetical protein